MSTALSPRLSFRLWRAFVVQDLQARYRGTAAGWLWPWLQTLAMLALYGLVFGVVFKASWPGTAGDDTTGFVLQLLTGILVFTLFADVLSAAPGALVRGGHYVKKTVMPLHVLPGVPLGAAAVHTLLGLVLMMLVAWALGRPVAATAPLALLPLALLAMMAVGLATGLAALGVYARDVQQAMPIITLALMMSGGVLFPKQSVPEPLRDWLWLNPVAWPVSAVRDALWSGTGPDAVHLALYGAAATLTCVAGYGIFKALRRGFADVL